MSKYIITKKDDCSKCGGTGFIKMPIPRGMEYSGTTSALCWICNGVGTVRSEVDLEDALKDLIRPGIANDLLKKL